MPVKDGWIPNQHGAWPMTVCPPFVGAFLGGFTWVQLWLGLTWLVAFLFFNVFGLWVKAKNKKRYLPALLTYGLVAAVSALGIVFLHPGLLWWGIPIAACFLVAAAEIFRRRERSLTARLSAIAASCLMTPITCFLGPTPTDTEHLTVVTMLLAAYFAGTVPYVKTLIRERGDEKWLWGSWIFHAVILVLTVTLFLIGSINVLVPISWAVLLIRAWAFPTYSAKNDRRIPPKIIGFSEVGFCVLTVGALLF